METKKFKIGRHNIEFENYYLGTRNGFKHSTILYIDGYQLVSGTCYYINRTWERYNYQSSMLKAAYTLRKQLVADITKQYKEYKGFKVINANRKAGLEKVIAKNNKIKLVDRIVKELA